MISYYSNFSSLINGSTTQTILDLGNHGFADSFFGEADFSKATDSVPLLCQLDSSTGLIQLLNMTEPIERYGQVDYSYTSANSTTSKNHWINLVSYFESRFINKESNILEIGSNDGFLLKMLQDNGHKVLGVDASRFMANVAANSGVKTLTGIFGESQELEDEILNVSNKFDIIIANNVLNHSNNPVSFVGNVKKLLDEEGTFTFEVPYWLKTITSLHFDQIYHEHITYFTVKSARELLKVCGLVIINVEVVNYHGGSLRITAAHENTQESPQVEKMIIVEELEGLFSPARYDEYFLKISNRKSVFMQNIAVLKKSGKTLFGIGAAAKANTLLTFYGLNTEFLDFIVDASEFKQGKITPVTKIPIFDDSHVRKFSNLTGIILAWNISDELQKNILQFNAGVEFIRL